MRPIIKKLFVSSAGQTTIEYVLIIGIIVTLIIGLTKQVRVFLLEDVGQCNANSTSIICRLENAFSFGGQGGNGFRSFRLRR